MEKYAVRDDDLKEELINEEHKLMVELSEKLAKVAHVDDSTKVLEARLNSVRDKIFELDMKK